MKKELKEIEDKILYLLSSVQGSPVDDERLIETLGASKETSEEIQKKLNAEGMQGWELVSTLPKLSGMHPRAFLLIFKRQK